MRPQLSQKPNGRGIPVSLGGSIHHRSCRVEPGLPNPIVVESMADIGYDLSKNKPNPVFTYDEESRQYKIRRQAGVSVLEQMLLARKSATTHSFEPTNTEETENFIQNTWLSKHLWPSCENDYEIYHNRPSLLSIDSKLKQIAPIIK